MIKFLTTIIIKPKMKYIIVDLEATCWQKREGRKNEIIEIGAVCINKSGETMGEFSQIIKPVQNPILSDFCTELTTITQDMVNKGLPFPEGLQLFLDWIHSFDAKYLLCSWGYYDKNQFEQDCQLHGLPTDWLEQHISVKHQYAKINGLKRPMGMKGTLKKEGLKLIGTHHRGIDDAQNIGRIFVRYLGRWNPEGLKKS